LPKVMTGDKSWIYGYGPETKQQSFQWKSPNSTRLKKVRQVNKSTFIIFFHIKGIVHGGFILAGQKVNSRYYCDVLQWLHKMYDDYAPNFDDWLLYHDNILTYQGISDQKQHDCRPLPPYLPDLATCNISLYPQLKIM
jgi:hypothetical protein